MLAFLVDPRWRIESRVLPWSGIYSVTVDGIVSHNAAMLTEGMNLLAIQRIFDRHNLRRGMRLALPDGRSLGRMDDIYFDAHGVIEGYATVTSQPGRAGYFVPAPKFLEVYADRAVVAEDTWRRMQENAIARRRLPNAAPGGGRPLAAQRRAVARFGRGRGVAAVGGRARRISPCTWSKDVACGLQS